MLTTARARSTATISSATMIRLNTTRQIVDRMTGATQSGAELTEADFGAIRGCGTTEVGFPDTCPSPRGTGSNVSGHPTPVSCAMRLSKSRAART